MRYKIDVTERERLFSSLKKISKTWKIAADRIGVVQKTLTAWKSGKSSIPEKALREILHMTNAPFPPSALELTDYWYTFHAGRIGAKVRYERHGNLGTVEGRRKGGLNAIRTHRSNESSRFQKEKLISLPAPSAELAELFGIFFGDGHVGAYQASVTLHSETDKEYGNYVSSLIEKQFSVRSVTRKKQGCNAIEIVISSKAFVRFLTTKGMPSGNKIRNGLSIPKWIMAKKRYLKAFLRGLFDTDGCIYLDKHTAKGVAYYHLGWTITSHSDTLIIDLQTALKSLGFCPTNSKNQHSVFLRRHQEIVRYFKIIDSYNPKHRKRLQKFLMEKSHSG